MRYRIKTVIFTDEHGDEQERFVPEKLTIRGYKNISSKIDKFETSHGSALRVINKYKSVKRNYEFIW